MDLVVRYPLDCHRTKGIQSDLQRDLGQRRALRSELTEDSLAQV